MYSFCGGDIFMIKIMFYVDILNTKVVDNFLVLLFLKFHDFRPTGLGVIDFTSLLSAFACHLNRSEWLYCLTYLNMESCIGDDRRVVVLLLSFPKYLRAPLFQSGMAGSVQIWIEMSSLGCLTLLAVEPS